MEVSAAAGIATEFSTRTALYFPPARCPAERAGEEGWAGLLYLSPDAPLRGGLKLWRNVDPAHNYDWMTPKENWELIDDLGNVPNRLLLCRGAGNCRHARQNFASRDRHPPA